MLETKRLLKSAIIKRFPQWIRDHEVFKTNEKVKKVFPSLGLHNNIQQYDNPVYDCAENKPKKMDIAFTSEGLTGMWDLATMSMRGVMSCMHWSNGHHTHLIGTMVDPCCGIIYLTDGSLTEYGLSINKRALVRYCVSYVLGARFLLVDRIYTKTDNNNPLIYRNHDENPEGIASIFEDYLKSKTSIPVVSSVKRNLTTDQWYSHIPEANVLRQLVPTHRSMVDSGFGYRIPVQQDVLELIN